MIAISVAFALVVAGVQSADGQRSGCLRNGDAISGEFRYVESRHPNGTSLRYGFVVTPEPVCVVGELVETGDPYIVRGRWVQISYAEDQIGGHPYPGDHVVVTADYFESHTAWHLGDIVGINARIVSREPM